MKIKLKPVYPVTLLLAAFTSPAAVINWTNTNGGNWSGATNWSGGKVPGAGDDVLIAAAGSYTVTQDVSTTVNSLTLGGASGTQTLTNAGFILNLNTNSVISGSGLLALSGGASLGGAGPLTVNGRLLSDNSNLHAAINVASVGALQLIGSGNHVLWAPLTNAGTINFQGGTLYVQGGSVLNNLASGLFDIQGDLLITANYNVGSIINAGLLRKSAGTGVATNQVPLANSGTLDVESGQIQYSGATTFNGGSVLSGAGANVVVGSLTLNGTFNSQNLVFSSGNVGGAGTLTGTAQWQASQFGSAATLALVVATNATLQLSGGTNHVLWSGLTNLGTIAFQSGTLYVQGGGLVWNAPSGLFDIQGDLLITANYNVGSIINAGVLRKSAGTGVATNQVPLVNSGTLDAQFGQIQYSGATTFNGGSVLSGAGANVIAGNLTLNGTFNSQNLVFSSGNVVGNGTLTGTAQWQASQFGLAATLALVVAPAATLQLSGGTNHVLWSGLTNLGTIAFQSGTLYVQGGGVLLNATGGVFDIQGDLAITANYNIGIITNSGTIRKSAGGGTNLFGVPLLNYGTVDAQAGVVRFLSTYSQTGGRLQFGLTSLTNFGQIQFSQTAPLTGTLGVNLLGGFRPKMGDSFAVISYPAYSGAFTAFDLPPVAAWQTNNSIYGASAVTLTVLNAQPSLAAIPVQTGDEQTSITFIASASDPDAGQTLTFSLVGQPGGASMDPASGSFSWTPTEAQGPSTNTFTVQVADTGSPPLINSQNVTVIVIEVNRAPTIIVPATQTLYELTTLTVTNLATDPDIPTNALTFSLVSAPAGVNLDPNTGVLAWTPTEAQGPSTNTITVAVTDYNPWAINAQHLSATNSFTVYVLESNSPPVLAAIPDMTAITGVLLLYTNSAGDPDLPPNILTFDLVTFPAGMSVDPASGVLSWTPTTAQAQNTNRVTVRVTDNGIPPMSDQKSFSVVVNPLPFLTIALAGTNVVLSWPAYATGFVLEHATNFQHAGAWSDVTNSVAAANGTNHVILGINNLHRWFRLRYGTGTTASPWLSVTLANGSVTLSWPKSADGWNLEYCATLSNNTNAWTRIPPPYATNATACYVSEPSPSGTKFYRLHKL
jgi:hypothetical protein